MSGLKIASIVLALASAALWFWSASLKPVYPAAYPSGAPKRITDQIDFHGKLNAWAAGVTGLSILLGGLADWLSVCG